MERPRAILNMYFPDDISQMILQIAYNLEHKDKYNLVLNDIKVDKINRVYDGLQEQMIQNSTYREICINNTNIIHIQPHMDINYFVLNTISEIDNIHIILNILSKCTCCPRHAYKKPTDLNADQNTYTLNFNMLNDVLNNEYEPETIKHKHKYVGKNGKTYLCYCKCRKVARIILISYHNIFHVNSFYYRNTLLYNYLVSKNKEKYHIDYIDNLKTDCKLKKRKRKRYSEIHKHMKELVNAKNDVKYSLAYLQYHIVTYPTIKNEQKYKTLYNQIPMDNIHIH